MQNPFRGITGRGARVSSSRNSKHGVSFFSNYEPRQAPSLLRACRLENLEQRALLSSVPPAINIEDAAAFAQVASAAHVDESPTTVIGETGTVTVGQSSPSEWHSVQFTNRYDKPIVVMGPASFNGNHPVTLRVRNVTDTGFQWQIDEWDYLDGWHKEETVGFLVLEAGTHTLEDGTKIVASATSANADFRSVSLREFDASPVVLTQVTSTYDDSPVVSRLRDVSSDEAGTGSPGTRRREDRR